MTGTFPARLLALPLLLCCMHVASSFETCRPGASCDSDDEAALLQNLNGGQGVIHTDETQDPPPSKPPPAKTLETEFQSQLLRMEPGHNDDKEAKKHKQAPTDAEATIETKCDDTFVCGTDYKKKEGAADITCSDAKFCTTEQCCTPKAVCGNQFDCPLGNMSITPYAMCADTKCTVAECCMDLPKGKCGTRTCPDHKKPKAKTFECLAHLCTMEECCDITTYIFVASATESCPKGSGYDGTILTAKECSAAATEIGTDLQLGESPMITKWRDADSTMTDLAGGPGVWGGNDGRNPPKHPCGCRLNKAFVKVTGEETEGILMLYGNKYTDGRDLSDACDKTAAASSGFLDEREYYGVFCKRTLAIGTIPTAAE